ncbi:alcohol dehydrogenase catalytic domain-containing protein [Pseudoalteromonas fenneropenaei]|uniref:Alcohol dehydrogenase catalytic domain-containing protein n=1 Tax=Pseudoalteromonas fenneropenaei TaxID=1737459 RepID=A0ABV7CL66_9GAMM
MKCLVACNEQTRSMLVDSGQFMAFNVEDTVTHIGLIDQPDIQFDKTDPNNATRVFIEVSAFSCNYREKSRMVKAALRQEIGFTILGSEFVAKVIDIGPAVTDFKVGDRVIGNGCVDLHIAQPGLSTQRASSQLQIIAQEKLISIPHTMSDTVAAAFSVGAQTAYSMANRLPTKENEHVLITAATSNTSLFAIKALLNRNVHVHALTTNSSMVEHLSAMGVQHICLINKNGVFDEQLKNYLTSKNIKYFDHIIDPFFDVYLCKLIRHIRRFGSYITCGVAQQTATSKCDSFTSQGLPMSEVFSLIIRKSISLVGNNLGITADLKNALEDYSAGKIQVDIDKTVINGDLQNFLTHTFQGVNRFGKVVFGYGSRP